MAVSNCVKCGGRSFELAQAEPRGSNYKLNFVQCSACGAVVGVTEYFNAGVKLQGLEKTVIELQTRLRSIESIAANVDVNLVRLFAARELKPDA